MPPPVELDEVVALVVALEDEALEEELDEVELDEDEVEPDDDVEPDEDVEPLLLVLEVLDGPSSPP